MQFDRECGSPVRLGDEQRDDEYRMTEFYHFMRAKFLNKASDPSSKVAECGVRGDSEIAFQKIKKQKSYFRTIRNNSCKKIIKVRIEIHESVVHLLSLFCSKDEYEDHQLACSFKNK